MKNVSLPFCAVLFDLDGTLVDTAPDIAAAVCTLLDELGLRRLSADAVRRCIGLGVPALLRTVLERTAAMTDDSARWDAIVRRYLELYEIENGQRSALYAGVDRALHILRERDVRLACVTNKPEAHARQLLQSLEILESFDVLVTPETTGYRKPSPIPLHFALDRLDVNARNALMVGDAPEDVGAARAAGITVWGVTYGYRSSELHGSFAPDATIGSLMEVATRYLV